MSRTVFAVILGLGLVGPIPGFAPPARANFETVGFRERMRLRNEIANRSSWRQKSGYEEDGANDPADLVDDGYLIRSLPAMEARGLKEAQLSEAPWSDDYWPVYAGGLGARYTDPLWPDTRDWRELRSYAQKNSAASIVARGVREEMELLSPSEKYSLWIGDAADVMTRRMWDEGRLHYEHTGKVETWMGICHGWAPASFMERRPLRKISVASADGKHELNFYPADLRALASLVWAKAYSDTRFIGRRCEEEEPERDATGRTVNPECRDINAGTWHMSVVSQIGAAKRSLILDATYDREVWNQPIYGYRYSYFNPQTRQVAAQWAQAVVPLAGFASDPYKRVRSPKATQLVGIAMELTYVVENRPQALDDETLEEPELRTVNYRYDLELNAAGDIVGGEWHYAPHPDFLWVPVPDAVPLTVGDIWIDDHSSVGPWDLGRTLSTDWMRAARESALRTQPMVKLVRGLIERSRATPN